MSSVVFSFPAATPHTIPFKHWHPPLAQNLILASGLRAVRLRRRRIASSLFSVQTAAASESQSHWPQVHVKAAEAVEDSSYHLPSTQDTPRPIGLELSEQETHERTQSHLRSAALAHVMHRVLA